MRWRSGATEAVALYGSTEVGMVEGVGGEGRLGEGDIGCL